MAVLENVVNPTNVGAIIRSAAALHMDAVLLTPGCCDPLYRRAIRVSMGTVFQIPWTFLSEEETGVWPRREMDALKSFGFATASMALCEKTVDIDDPRLLAEEKVAVILGTEGGGPSEETIASSDYAVKIPMSHGVGFSERGRGQRCGLLGVAAPALTKILYRYQKEYEKSEGSCISVTQSTGNRGAVCQNQTLAGGIDFFLFGQ